MMTLDGREAAPPVRVQGLLRRGRILSTTSPVRAGQRPFSRRKPEWPLTVCCDRPVKTERAGAGAVTVSLPKVNLGCHPVNNCKQVASESA